MIEVFDGPEDLCHDDISSNISLCVNKSYASTTRDSVDGEGDTTGCKSDHISPFDDKSKIENSLASTLALAGEHQQYSDKRFVGSNNDDIPNCGIAGECGNNLDNWDHFNGEEINRKDNLLSQQQDENYNTAQDVGKSTISLTLFLRG